MSSFTVLSRDQTQVINLEASAFTRGAIATPPFMYFKAILSRYIHGVVVCIKNGPSGEAHICVFIPQ